ncbi:MAG: C25 family cysteine peptidase, partial [bacterium]
YTIADQFKSTSGSSGVHVAPLDYGDLPETNYLTTRQTTGNSGPAHVITDDLFMGTNFATDIDAEGDGQPNATATGDDTVNQSDENAVTFPTFVQGQSADVTVSVTNNTGGNATLYGFIDWNGDGDFDDTGETITTTVADGTAGNVTLTINVPAGAMTGTDLGARFRLSTDTTLGATDPLGNNGPIPAPDGEVEDYHIQVDIQQQLGSISGTVYNDIDANASLDGSDFGLTGITVTLSDSNGNMFTTTTAADGSYTFPDLLPDDYSVSVDTSSLPTGSNLADPTQTEDPDETGVCTVCDSQTTTPITLAAGENVTDVDFGYTGDSLPVTLSSVSTGLLGDKVKLDWSTSSELFNVGFQLWGLDATDSKWKKLHGWLIRSGSGNAVDPQSYSKTLRIPKSINNLAALGISSVDSDGSEHYYGPFNVGQSYGNLSNLKPIAWNHIRAQVDAQMARRGYVKDRVNGYRKVNTASVSSSAVETVIELSVRDAGLYRVTVQSMLNVGIDWREIEKRDIALLNHAGNGVVRYVFAQGSGSGNAKTLGTNGEIYFYSPGVDAQAGIYTQTRVYRLVIDRNRALNGRYQRAQGIGSGYSDFYMETSRVENDVRYELSSAADDPWVDAVVVSYPDKTGSYGAAIPVEDDALWSQPSRLHLQLARNSGLRTVDSDGNGQADPEHMVEGQVLSSNGTGGLLALGSAQAIGKGDWPVEFEIPGNTELTLVNGNAVVGGIFSAGAGYQMSEVHVDGASLTYARPYSAKVGDDYLTFTGPDNGELGYAVTVPNVGWPVIFAYNESGALVRLAFESQRRVTSADGSRQRVVKVARLKGAGTQSSPVQYWVSGKLGYLSVVSMTAKSVASQSSMLAQAAGSNYLLIAHPMFMDATLDDYASFKRSQGYRVSIINYLEIVDVFGGGQIGPHGLTDYLKQIEAQSDLEHVLLVGGSSYDHTDKLGTGAITFIPGHYGQSNYSKFTVSDVPYINAADNQFFADIGRWPVRSASDLQMIVDKSMTFANADHSQGHVLSIAEHTAGNENIDFAMALNDMIPLVPPTWSLSEVHVDKVAKANNLSLPNDLPQALSLAKNEIIKELNNTPDVVLYNGHGTTSQLSNKGLFKSSNVASVTAPGGEIWLPMSCYVTYYESTHMNTLAHQLLFYGNAVGISGAMLLSSQGGNIAAGSAILDSTLNNGKQIGEAVNAHKMQHNNPGLNINWALLGDPTLRM